MRRRAGCAGAIVAGVMAAAVLAGCGATTTQNYGTISTFAGNGTHANTGDGGAATSASLNAPACVAADAAGNVFVGDSAAHVVRRVSTAGTISRYAGVGSPGFNGDGGAATSAGLNAPQGCAVDATGNLYIADSMNNVVRRVAAGTGVITTVAGNGVGTGYFPTPFSGDGGLATAAGIGQPYGVAVDAAGNLYISDTMNQRVRKVTAATGIITTIAGNGTAGFTGDGGAATSATLHNPEGLAVDGSGNVYVAEEANSIIRRIAANGTISTFAGSNMYGFFGDGHAATDARLNGPTAVFVDTQGNVYIADSGNNGIRRVNSGGTIQSVVGNGDTGYSGDGKAASDAAVNAPRGVTLDASGKMYIADTGNGVVRRVTP